MEQHIIPRKEREHELIKILKSKIVGKHDNANLCGVYIDSIMNGRELQTKLLLWLRENPNSTADDVLLKWEEIRPERDEDFDYDTLPYEDDE